MVTSTPPNVPPQATRRRRPPQFTIFGLMVLTFVVSIAMAPVYYMVRAMQGDTGSRAVTVLMSVALPMLLMILLSISLQVNRWLKRRK